MAIACGGTGGHLFPGLAVAEALQERGCDIALLISPKEVDQHAVKAAHGMEVVTIPAVGFALSTVFFSSAFKSFQICRRQFRARPPQAVLAMGGFTSAAPVIAGKISGAATFLHEANSIPGKANRWLAPLVDEVFVGFPSAAPLLKNSAVTVTGTPVRTSFSVSDPAACRMAMGLDPARPTLLVMGGSQGASAINELAMTALPLFRSKAPAWQYLHLTGERDCEKVRSAYQAHQMKAMVRPFLTEMELALGAATVAINRAGASSLAEMAAMRLPCILIPYPTAADNHQYFNAKAFMESGAARQLDQASANPEHLVKLVLELGADSIVRQHMCTALQHWHFPDAATHIAERMLALMRKPRPVAPERTGPDPKTERNKHWPSPHQVTLANRALQKSESIKPTELQSP
ncbi:MAG: undecaprenyldiphospho-muramoylpentapeptide beta-N-acetylglucosaminyltransferase [Verrucomicrobiota bacterium]